MSNAETYCLGRSLWLRARPADARWLIRLAAEQLPASPGAPIGPLRDRMTAALESAVRGGRYGSPVLLWLLLNIVVPIVVRLVIEWWLSRPSDAHGKE